MPQTPDQSRKAERAEAFREAAQERAAILEFDAGLPRAEAEVQARTMVLREFQGAA